MTQDDKNIAEQPTENSSLGSTDQAGGKQPAGVKSHASDLASKVGEHRERVRPCFRHIARRNQDDSFQCFGFG